MGESSGAFLGRTSTKRMSPSTRMAEKMTRMASVTISVSPPNPAPPAAAPCPPPGDEPSPVPRKGSNSTTNRRGSLVSGGSPESLARTWSAHFHRVTAALPDIADDPHGPCWRRASLANTSPVCAFTENRPDSSTKQGATTGCC